MRPESRARHALCAVLYLSSGVFSGPLLAKDRTPQTCGPGVTLKLSAPSSSQGSLLLLEIRSRKLLAEVRAEWNSKSVPFWQVHNASPDTSKVASADLRQALVDVAGALGQSVLQIILSLVVATFFWVSGDTLAATLRDILRRLGGETAGAELDVAAGAVRSVAYGVVGTAVIQAVIMAIGLAVAGVPGAVLLGFVTLLLALSQIGAPLIIVVWAGAAFWLFGQGQPGWGVFMIFWGLVVTVIDNFIKPFLIGVGVEMPLSLTILGVFGGFVAFGFLGLFIGPTLIAIAFTLLEAWRSAPTATPGAAVG